ncbi:PIG-L family deacetylase [Cryptosporangium phraense]|uniref:GlcNAc-PI de-N-acetylase n=1 Tax=Cryptosporangium phraense TaxID=2593070 RepID=A0A545AEB8_9ACTN|nr:PIG-L family deacetylase [Cryptosporangium phraense]TQS39649.1 GlcNAc-PI de-N-acetylase [Cryptosporangium phraense]
MIDRPLVLLAVHAHPDDEVTGTGGVLARYAAEGVTTVVVTCTDGRCGDGPNGVKPGEPGHDPEAVAATRSAELDASVAELKVTHLERLGYHDSGMMGWPTNDAPGSFWSTPVPEAAEKLAALLRQYRPDVVLTYDEIGGYGHPDHIQVNRVTMAALDRLDDPPAKVYWNTIPLSWVESIAERMREIGQEWEEPEPDENGERPVMGLPDDQITTWIDTGEYADQKYDALSHHASQGDGAFFINLGKERFGELMRMETFLRVRDTTDAPVPEDDLFAGLR